MERDISKLKEWMIKKRISGWSVVKICAHAQVSRHMFYRWWDRYQANGLEALKEKPKGRKVLYEINPKLEKQIISLRKEYGWGPCKIEAFFKRTNIKIAHNTVYKIIANTGLNNPIDKPRKTWGKIRFERTHSNSLWQADWKLSEKDYWMITYLDDHSRFIVGSEKFWDPTTDNALNLFEKAVKKYGKPVQVLTDRGIQFYCADKEGKKQGESVFTQTLEDMGIEHIVCSKRRPTTIGKVEAWHKAYECEAWRYKTLRRFVYYWNYKRLHQGINYLIPAELYFKDRV